ncbi:MAG: hypothetical protein KDA24_02755 [Deltaproteobacteria bacterium]|nr:hypothetical protein [Deltaproteobacteria bacterium]
MHRSPVWGVGALLVVSCALLVASCGGGDDDSSAGTSTPGVENSGGDGISESWMFKVAERPELLAPMEKQGVVGNAWLDLYHNDLRTAVNAFGKACTPSAKSYADRAADGFPCVGLARTHLEKGTTLAQGAEIDRVARRQFYAHRRDRPEDVLASVHQDYFEGLNLLRSGDEAKGKELLGAYAGNAAADPLLAHLAKTISAGWGSDPLISRMWGSAKEYAPADATLGELPTSEATASYALRLVVMQAVARGDYDGATANLRPVKDNIADMLEKLEQSQESGEKLEVALFHFDSTYLRTLARWNGLAAHRATAGAGDLGMLVAEADILLGRAATIPTEAPSIEDGLAYVVFSGWLSPADRLADLSGTGQPASLIRLGKAFPGLSSSAAAKLSDLDAFVGLSNELKATLREKIRGTGPEGHNMDQGMGLSERFLGRLLLDGATDLQRAMDVRLDEKAGSDMETAGVSARSLLESAMDKNPTPPNQQLRNARISFRNDPTLLMELARANLDTKRPYYANDYIRPLTEVYSELIPVREGLAALDSAWNPARAGAVR